MVLKALGVDLLAHLVGGDALRSRSQSVRTEDGAAIGLDSHEVVAAGGFQKAFVDVAAGRVSKVLAAVDGLDIGVCKRPAHLQLRPPGLDGCRGGPVRRQLYVKRGLCGSELERGHRTGGHAQALRGCSPNRNRTAVFRGLAEQSDGFQ